MSVQAMSFVIDNSQQKGSALLMLLMVANHARADGAGAWPSLQTLADECRMSRRQAVRLIAYLEESGELTVERNAGPHRCHLYSIRHMVGGDKLSLSAEEGGVTPTTAGSDISGGGGDTDDSQGVTPMSPEPSLEPSLENHQDPSLFERLKKRSKTTKAADGEEAVWCSRLRSWVWESDAWMLQEEDLAS